MLIELIIFLFLGLAAGTLTGIIPGIHINLIGAFLVTLSASLLSSINPIYLVTFVVSMAITHTFLDFIPSIFLGCPDTDTELSVLPGHQMLKQGQGHEAILLSSYGSLVAIFILLFLTFPSIIIISKIYDNLFSLTPYFLIMVSIFLISLENKKLKSLFVFALAGFLGLVVLNMDVKEPLLPLLSGLFGASTLLISIKTKTNLPKQKTEKPKLKSFNFKPLLGSLIASPLCSFLPGLGSGQAAVIGSQIVKHPKKDNRGFIVLLGATNTLVMGFSFISLYVISRTRTGTAAAIEQIIGTFNINILILILTVVLISGIISFFLTIHVSKLFLKFMEKINYAKISAATLFLLSLVVLIFSGFLGFLILIVSTLTGIYAISLGTRRINLMGCLLIPTIVFYLF